MRELFVKIIRSVIGRPYKWGGQSPETGFDCSGLIIWGLNQVNIKVPDMTVLDIYRHFGNNEISIRICSPGSLLFYGKTHMTINHVMVVLDRWDDEYFTICGARGGNSKTINNRKAYDRSAYVDVCKGNYWQPNLRVAVDPFM